jgi:uncharacterized protein
MKTKNNPCLDCNAACCRELSVDIGTPKTKKDWEEIKWLVVHKNVHVYQDNENDWMVEFISPCEKLDEKGLCKIYDKRPGVCSEHSHEYCVHHNSENYYKIIFKKLEDVEAHLKKKNYKWMKN